MKDGLSSIFIITEHQLANRWFGFVQASLFVNELACFPRVDHTQSDRNFPIELWF
jgi:hypothetical protein